MAFNQGMPTTNSKSALTTDSLLLFNPMAYLRHGTIHFYPT